MGVFDERADDVIVIRDEKNWEPHETATVRTVVKVSDFEWVQNQLVLIKQSAPKRRGAFQRDQGMDIQAQTGASDRLWVFRMLKSWTFTKGGMPVPFTLQAVRELPQSVLNFIYNEIQQRQPKDAEEEAASGDDGQDNEEGSAFFDAASLSIDDNIRSESLDAKPKVSRNFLSK